MMRSPHARPVHDWTLFRTAERAVRVFAPHATYRLALAWANSYRVGMSSLGLQRVYDLVDATPDWSCERFFTDGTGRPRSVETGTPLDEFGAVAFSVSFEEDYVGLLRLLARAGIARRRDERGPDDPVIILGGPCAVINPLPMAAFVDVFALGAAENLLPDLLAALAEESRREDVLARLATRPGFFVPAHHRPETEPPEPKLRQLELTAEQMQRPGHLPTSVIVTPHTELSDKFLIEMSRGCPEKCRYCWATFGMGRFRWHPTEHVLAALDRARAVTDQVGFVATAVGDHPEIGRILSQAERLGLRSSVSSMRIPAVTEEVLEPLRASGARSLTLAPETGSDELRRALNKPIPNALIEDRVRRIFRHGFTQLKLYFLIGLPGETEADVGAIVDLAARCRTAMVEEAAGSGRLGTIQLGVNVLIPKPFTPWQREPLADPRSLKARIALLRRGVAALPNVSLGSTSIRQAVWQTFLSRAGSDAAEVIERVARGESPAAVLRRSPELVRAAVFAPQPRRLRWHFMRLR